MEKQLKLEELGMFGLGVILFTFLDYAWWIFPALILVPDISMAGYAVNERIGAKVYNLFHHKAFAVFVFVVGLMTDISLLQLAGVILFSHSCLDRMFGYGLKYPDSFRHTHLGWIGKKQQKV